MLLEETKEQESALGGIHSSEPGAGPEDPKAARRRRASTRQSLRVINGICADCVATNPNKAHNNRKGYGSSEPDIMLVTQSPLVLSTSIEKSIPHQKFEALLRKCGIGDMKWRASGAIRCLAQNFNFSCQHSNLCKEDPTFVATVKDAAKICGPNVVDEILIADPKVVVLMGPAAAKAVLGINAMLNVSPHIGDTHVDEDGRLYYITYGFDLYGKSSEIDQSIEVTLKRGIEKALKNFSNPTDGYKQITTEAQLKKLPDLLAKVPYLVFDFEIDTVITKDRKGFDESDKIIGCGFSWGPGKAIFIPLDHKDSPFAENSLNVLAHQTVKKILTNDVPKVAHNAIYDSYVLFHFYGGLMVRNMSFDTMLTSHLINPSEPTHGLKKLLSKYTVSGGYEHEVQSQLDAMPASIRSYGLIDLETISKYCMEDCSGTAILKEKYTEILNKKPKLKKLFDKITMPAYHMVFDLKMRGWPIDEREFEALGVKFEEILVELDKTIKENKYVKKFNPTINIDSTKELQAFLFTDLHLPPVKRTKTGFSTDKDTISYLASTVKNKDKVEFLQAVQGIKKYRRLLSTNINGFRKHIENGKVHTSYLLHGTRTARLSSIQPNLQNVPPDVKSCFKAPEGYEMVFCDYSQIELRMIANQTKDPQLVGAFLNGEDPHKKTAALIFNTSLNDVKPWQRKVGKTLNFSIVYGAGAKRVAQTLEEEAGFSEDDIQEIREQLKLDERISEKRSAVLLVLADKALMSIKTAYVGLNDYKREAQKLAQNKYNCIVRTRFGRERNLSSEEYYSKGREWVGQLVNQAMNTPIQSASSDCTMLGLIKAHQTLKRLKFKSHLIGQIHDSGVFIVKKDEKAQVLRIVKSCFEQEPLKFDPEFFLVPLVVEFECGDDWGSLKPYADPIELIDYESMLGGNI